MSAARAQGRGPLSTAWRGLEGLRVALAAAAELPSAAGLDPLCNSPAWMHAHAAAFAGPDGPFGWSFTDGGTDGGAPLACFALRREPGRGRLALRRAILCQDGTFDSDYLGLWIRPGAELAALRALIQELSGAGGIDALVLSGLEAGAPALAALRQLVAELGLPARETPVPCCAAPLPASFDAYVLGLKPRMRSKLRASLRQAESRGARFLWCREPADLPRRLDELFALHARRWESEGRPGAFADERRRAFYRALAAEGLARGALRFGRLELDGRSVACQLGLALGGTYYQLQEGYEPELAELRVGTALRALAVRSLIEEGTARYDFMAGVTRHKEEWGALPRPCVTFAFPLPRLLPKLAYHARAWAARLKRDDGGPGAQD